jgi:hypothetical protein
VTLFVDYRSGAEIPFAIGDVVLAGYTGRDQSAVMKHVEELRAHGVPAPEQVPAFYRVSPDRVVVDQRISVLGKETSGEAEFTLFVSAGKLYVGVGSDHTDRALERVSVTNAKQACPKVVAPDVVSYEEVASYWSQIDLRSSVGPAGSERTYQSGGVAELLDPEQILRLIEKRTGGSLEGVLVFSGTLPLAGDLEYSDRFVAELVDQDHDLLLRCSYEVQVSEPLD